MNLPVGIPVVQGVIDRRILINFQLDGLELRSRSWRVEPLAVERVRSSIEHEWHVMEPLCHCEPSAA